MAWLTQKTDHYLIEVILAPRASRNAVIGEYNGALKIAVTSLPVEGRANEALIAFLSKQLKVARNRIEIVSGHTSKRKKLRLPLESQVGLLV